MTDKGKLLRGAPAIAAHVFGPDAGLSEQRAIFNMCDAWVCSTLVAASLGTPA
jgi:hypothetical protein